MSEASYSRTLDSLANIYNTRCIPKYLPSRSAQPCLRDKSRNGHTNEPREDRSRAMVCQAAVDTLKHIAVAILSHCTPTILPPSTNPPTHPFTHSTNHAIASPSSPRVHSPTVSPECLKSGRYDKLSCSFLLELNMGEEILLLLLFQVCCYFFGGMV